MVLINYFLSVSFACLLDFIVPKGFFVVPFLSAVHLNENLYKGALDFNPWRWMDENNKVT